MNILLINPIIRPSEPPAYYPMGLGYISSVLMLERHKVDFLDLNALRPKAEEVYNLINRYNPDVIAITGFVTEYKYIKWLINTVKYIHSDKPIIFGGGLACVAGDLLFQRTHVDILVIGEGENTMKDLVSVIERHSDLSSVDGIWYRKDGVIHKNKPRNQIEFLDAIPFPDRRDEYFEVYIRNMSDRNLFKDYVRVTDIMTSRGCPYNCTYCDHSIWGKKFRARSANNIVAEIKYLHYIYDIDGIIFNDDTFLLDRDRIMGFCYLMREANMGVRWRCNARVDLVDEAVLDEMKSVGCEVIAYGIESGSQKILDEIRKGVTVDQARKAIELTKSVGIKPIAYIMVGLPGETRETVEDTVNFCKSLNLKLAGINYTTPIPGTELYRKSLEKGKITMSLEEQLESWDMWQDNIMINISGLSNEELTNLKKYEEKNLYTVGLHEVCNYYQKHGIIELIKKAMTR